MPFATLFAQSSSAGALDVATPVGILVAAIALAAGGGMLWLRASTRPTPIRNLASTMELRDEPPAIVDLLTGGFDLDDDAMPATVVDLAARGWFSIDEIGGDRIVLQLRSRRPDERLTPYEQRVLKHIERNQTDGVVPAPVLTLGPQGVSERWFRSFSREVTRHARELGLCHRRWDLKHLAIAWGFVTAAGLPAALVASAAPRTDDPAGWGSPGNLLVGLSFVVAIALAWFAQGLTRSDAQVDTEAGREAARHWLGVREYFADHGRFDEKPAASVAIWDRNLAYATAMGLAPLVQRQLPFETEHDRNAWSRMTGHWRRVRVSYAAPRPSWGRSPWSAAFAGLVQAVVTGVLAGFAFYVAGADIDLDQLTADQRRTVGLVALIVAILFAAMCVVAVLRFALGISDLFVRRTVEGELIRRRARQRGDRLPPLLRWLYRNQRDTTGQQRSQTLQTTYHLAIDTGGRDRVRTFRVRRPIYAAVRQGSRVRATVTPRLGYVSSIEELAPPPTDSPDADPSLAHPLIAETVRRATQGISQRLESVGGVAGMREHLEGVTDDQGRPILDQPDDDGVTLRERMAHGDAELQRALDDPRIAGTPLLGQILGTLRGDGRPDADRDPPHEDEPHRDDGPHR